MTDHGELSALRDRIRDLELTLEQKTSEMNKLEGWYCDALRQVGRDGARIQELERELEQSKARAVEWVSVEERLPAADSQVLVEFGDGVVSAMIHCLGEMWEEVGSQGQASTREWLIVRWAPLPKPPEEVGG